KLNIDSRPQAIVLAYEAGMGRKNINKKKNKGGIKRKKGTTLGAVPFCASNDGKISSRSRYQPDPAKLSAVHQSTS
ncbi:MAG: hypothetical protein U9N63_01870, partial [Pseudomonadota bacterium]|nr:hypothetical protein [Pseudomonadota bacterium]